MDDVKIFTSGDGKKLNHAEMIFNIAKYIQKDQNSDYEITIGTDSQSTTDTKIVEVVAVRRIGKGGIFFYHSDVVENFKSLRDKIYEETHRSLRNARGFIDELSNVLFGFETPIFIHNLNISFKIHCDIGSCGKTCSLIKEIVNWVHSVGYECVIKPDSYAASGIANKFSK